MLTMLVLVGGVSHAANFQKGLEAAQKGDFKTAYEEWIPLAEAGDALSQYNIGLMYRNGDGVSQNDRKAFFWFGKAASQGLAAAQDRLGWMYANGVGTEKDMRKGITWTYLASRQGDKTAKTNLRVMQSHLAETYMLGLEGHRKDVYLAFLWFSLAGRCGDDVSEAMANAMKNTLLSTEELRRAEAEMKRCLATAYTKCGDPG